MADFSREWELGGRKHRTADDACAQVLLGKMGSLVAASDEYLAALRRELYKWIDGVDEELYRRELAASRAEDQK